MGLLDVLCIVTAILEITLYAGIHQGWPYMQDILIAENYFSDSCNSDGLNATYIGTVAPSNGSEISQNMFLSQEENIELNIFESNCIQQEENLNLVYTIGSTITSFTSFADGIILDKFGTWVSKSISITFMMIGCVMIAFSNAVYSWTLYIAFTLLAIGGYNVTLADTQVANLCGKFKNLFVSFISGCHYATVVIFLAMKYLYENGYSLKNMFLIYTASLTLLYLRNLLLMPRMHITVPPAKKYGLIYECFGGKKTEDNLTNDDTMEEENLKKKRDSLEMIDPKEKMTFKECILSKPFVASLFSFCVWLFRRRFFYGSVNAWLKQLTNANNYSYYLNLFGYIQFSSPFVCLIIGLIMDYTNAFYRRKKYLPKVATMKAAFLGATVTAILAVLFSATVLIPNLNLQIFSFILFAPFNAFASAFLSAFILSTFPTRHFGKLYGLHHIIGGIFLFLQQPLYSLSLNQFKGSFTVVNCVLLALSFLSFFQPIVLFFQMKKIKNPLIQESEDLEIIS